MAPAYLDTSLVVAALTAEPLTDVAQRYLTGEAFSLPVISDWSLTEVSAALSIKVRVGGADGKGPPVRALSVLRGLVDHSFDCLPVSRADFRAAARLADQARSGLRAGDAPHLAVASGAGLVVHTLDRSMARSADELGIPSVLAATS